MKIFVRVAVYTSLCLLGISTLFTTSYGQSDNLVRNRLKRIALGDADEVRKELPDLLADFPSDPGVKLLHAILVDDAARALPLFEAIVQGYPQSEWADDAQWRVVQIYAVRKDTVRAWQELKEYRKAYPDSEFLLFASELVKNTVGGSFPTKKAEVYKSKPAAPASTAAAVPKTPPSHSTPVQPKDAKNTKNTEEHDPPSAATAPKKESKKESEGVYSLQVGLYSTEQGAEAEVAKFRQARMRTEVLEKMVGNEKKYAVIIGSYSSREAADKAKETVEKYCNCTPFVIER